MDGSGAGIPELDPLVIRRGECAGPGDFIDEDRPGRVTRRDEEAVFLSRRRPEPVDQDVIPVGQTAIRQVVGLTPQVAELVYGRSIGRRESNRVAAVVEG